MTSLAHRIIDVETLCREYFYTYKGAPKDSPVNLYNLHVAVKNVGWSDVTIGQSKPYSRKINVNYAPGARDTLSDLVVTKTNKKERELKFNDLLVRGLKNKNEVNLSLDSSGLPDPVPRLFRDCMRVNIGQEVNVLAELDPSGDVRRQERNKWQQNAEIVDAPNHCRATFSCTLQLDGTVICNVHEQHIEEIFQKMVNGQLYGPVEIVMTGTCDFNWASEPTINWQ